MVNILNDAIYDKFMSLVENANNEIRLCVPFIKTNIVNEILTYKKSNVNITAITNVKLMSFYKKVLDVGALSNLLSSNGKLYNYPSLHAKFYIFDDKELIITSANLTEAGLKKNKEYGIISDDKNLVLMANNDFDKMCNDEITGKIKQKHLNDIMEILESFPKDTRIDLPKYEIENEEVYSYSIIESTPSLLGWKKDIYDIIIKFDNDHFELKDFESYIPYLKILYPRNNFVEEKIRQILQQLRDLGLIKFEGNGCYMRLFR